MGWMNSLMTENYVKKIKGAADKNGPKSSTGKSGFRDQLAQIFSE